MGEVPTTDWIAFGAVVASLLCVDLFVHRGGRHASRRAAIGWSVVWVAVGFAFGGYVWATMGPGAGAEYLGAYLIEKSLSLDNLFVFLVVFTSMQIPTRYQHTVLWWGILGALVFRAIFIFAGVAALERFSWIAYVFGAVLAFAAYRMFRHDPAEQQENRIVRWLSRHVPVTTSVEGARFFACENGRRVATPLLVALIGLELTDIVFALDSVPAAFSVTREPFLLYSSNAFAILGLRALYLVLAHTIADLKYLHYGLAGVLLFAALKLAAHDLVTVPPWLSIAIIVAILAPAILASVRWSRRHPREHAAMKRRRKARQAGAEHPAASGRA